MARLRVPGELVTPGEPDLGELQGRAATANVQGLKVGALRAGEAPHELEVNPDTIVEITLENGAKFYHRFDQLAEDTPGSRSRGAPAEHAVVELPVVLPGPATRGGAAALVVTSVRTFDLDLSALGDIAGKLAGKPLAEKFDSWRAANFGLRSWSLDTGALGTQVLAPDDVAAVAGRDALLLFIHGTGSSTQGGFGAIPGLEAVSTASHTRALETLRKTYADRVVAFDHPTLSVSPIVNAIKLLESLPVAARLHLVTHSRGGMIGELLCWPAPTDGPLPFAAELEAARSRAARAGVNYGEQIEQLAELGRLLRDKRPFVERFVRVASPAAGTTLASGRLDRWLSLATSALSLTGLGASQTYQFLKGFLLAVVKTRTDPRAVPGLEAMMPRSLLTMLLNRPGVETKADLSVIAGDIEGRSLLGRLGLQAVDWFYGGDHDLVVDTVSMYGGLARAKPGARFFFDKGDTVSHFNYFRNEKSLGRMVDALVRTTDEVTGFSRLDRAEEISAFLAQRRASAARSVVFLVPDAMASHLSADGKRLWVDLAALARGAFETLARQPANPLTADALVADVYGPLVQHLSTAYEVVPYPFDWRLPITDNGTRLAEALRRRLADNPSEPVRILAHGAGALVALAAFTGDTALREQFAARNGARLLLLDPPLQGSLHIARLLLGLARLNRHLAMLTFDPYVADVTAMLGKLPGLVDLLPPELLDGAAWSRIAGAELAGAPAQALLDGSRQRRELIRSPETLGLPLAIVNGVAAASRRMILESGQVRFFAGGATPKAANAAIAERTWWVSAEPGELAAFEPAFDAYTELLATGATRHLPQEPADPAGLREAVELPAEEPSVFPDAPELAAAALGYARRPAAPIKRTTTIRLVHGNLAFASWPVAVGHYEGDMLAGSEAQLDRALDGRLSRRRDIRVYPGRIGSAEIVLDFARSPKGAVVIGLGPVGSLTPGHLNRTLSQALRRYALAVREIRALPAGEMAISMILIGTGAGGIRTADALAALLDAIKYANTMLGDDAFTEVELLELYRDRAIEAAHALLRLDLGVRGPFGTFSFDGLVHTREGGRWQAAPAQDPSWWRRLKIEARPDGSLLFSDLTDRARLPERPVASQHKVSAFVAGAVTEVAPAKEYSVSGTLYELLLPADFKREANDDRHRVLVLDRTTASYPWELLCRPGRKDEKPLSVRAGMIRQMIEPDTPDRPVVTTDFRALVIGNPPSGLRELPPLPGAAAEARAVEAVLNRNKFSVTSRIECSDGSTSLPPLLCGRWRVLHLAGHGVVDLQRPGRTVTGMAIENGFFFEPADVGQMEAIPELVFINCCFLGSVSPSKERKASARFHELAANVATTFIKLGARAVVAAGWAVDDNAAKRFAEVFYERLLSGCAFGDATLAARAAVYDEGFASTNTWGAYQCYGDPAYRLLLDGARAESAPMKTCYVHVDELIGDIRDVIQDSQTLAIRDPDPLRNRLRQIASSVFVARWADNTELQAALGDAYAELGLIDEAIESYTRAVQAEKAHAPIRAVEQLANLLARRAVKPRPKGRPKQEIRQAIALLAGLPKLPDRGHTAERWSLIGSCYKRLAHIATGDERITALREMRRCYDLAFRRKDAQKEFGTYPLLNRLMADKLLAVFGQEDKDGGAEASDPDALLQRAETEARRLDDKDPNFWNGVTRADIMLGRAVLEGRLDAPMQQDVIAAYLRPWRRGASALKFASALGQIEFLIAILRSDAAAADAQRTALCSGLDAILTQLRTATGVS